MGDKEIVDLYLSRDEEAIRKTEMKYGSYLMKIAVNILGDPEEAKEVVNETYLAAWNSIPDNRPVKLSTYLGKIIRRISIDAIRKRSSLKRKTSEYTVCLSEIEETFPGGVDPEENLKYSILNEKIHDFLSRLSSEDRDLFIGRYYYFDSLKDVASYCGMKETRAKSRLYRIRQELKDHLRKEGYEL